MNRRHFLAVAGASLAGCACCDVIARGAPATASKDDKPIDIGTIADYPRDGISTKFARADQILVIRNKRRIYASSALCTHRACTLNLKANGATQLACRCHGSTFSIQGTVTKGPADASLERFAISKSEGGRLIVDPTKSFREKKWESVESYIEVK